MKICQTTYKITLFAQKNEDKKKIITDPLISFEFFIIRLIWDCNPLRKNWMKNYVEHQKYLLRRKKWKDCFDGFNIWRIDLKNRILIIWILYEHKKLALYLSHGYFLVIYINNSFIYFFKLSSWIENLYIQVFFIYSSWI